MVPFPEHLEEILSGLTVRDLPRHYRWQIMSKVDEMESHSVLDDPEMKEALAKYTVGDLPNSVFKDILVGNSAEVLKSWESPYEFPDEVLSRLKLSAFEEVIDGKKPECLESTMEKRRVRKKLVQALESGLKDFRQLPLAALPENLYRRLDNWMGHKGVMPEEVNEIYGRYNERRSEELPELRESVMDTQVLELPTSVLEEFDPAELAETLCFYETVRLLKEYLGTPEHMARVFKVMFASDLNNPGEGVERVSESLEEGWKRGYSPGCCDCLVQYLFSMSAREDWSLKWAVDEYVRKSEETHGVRKEGYRQRAREMLETLAAELQDPIDAIREKYGLEPLNLSR